MGRKKLARFKEIETFENVIEPSKDIYKDIKGGWHAFFGNNNPIVLELGCGRGEYTNGLALVMPEKNFIGVDIKGERIWQASNMARTIKIDNSAFLRAQIQKIDEFFKRDEVSQIWITFPDPRPEKERHRLTNPKFLEMYKKILLPKGKFHLKTDNTPFFDYTIRVLNERNDIKDLKSTYNLYNSELKKECFGIKTKYEQIFTEAGEDIKYLEFSFVG